MKSPLDFWLFIPHFIAKVFFNTPQPFNFLISFSGFKTVNNQSQDEKEVQVVENHHTLEEEPVGMSIGDSQEDEKIVGFIYLETTTDNISFCFSALFCQ